MLSSWQTIKINISLYLNQYFLTSYRLNMFIFPSIFSTLLFTYLVALTGLIKSELLDSFSIRGSSPLINPLTPSQNSLPKIWEIFHHPLSNHYFHYTFSTCGSIALLSFLNIMSINDFKISTI